MSLGLPIIDLAGEVLNFETNCFPVPSIKALISYFCGPGNLLTK
jgi:hypothetical protein